MSHQFKNAWNLTTDVATIVAKAGGYNSVAHYEYESDVIHQIHLIKKPFFFFSSLDDPFFGPDVIPIDHCHD